MEMKQLRKSNLHTGDIVRNRAGYLGIIVNDKIIYQVLDSDNLDHFNDDLTSKNEIFSPWDIMEIHHGSDLYEVELDESDDVEMRDYFFSIPSANTRTQRSKQAYISENQNLIHEIKQKQLQNNLKVIQSDPDFEIKMWEIDRTRILEYLHGLDESNIEMIQIPNTHFVVVYDKYQENKYTKYDFPKAFILNNGNYFRKYQQNMQMHIACIIDEINFKIHTRCFFCRIDENKQLQSILDSDYDLIKQYLPQ